MIYGFFKDWSTEAISLMEEPPTDEEMLEEARTWAEIKMQQLGYNKLAEPEEQMQFYKLVTTGVIYTSIDGEQEEQTQMELVPREEAEYIRVLLRYPCEEYRP